MLKVKVQKNNIERAIKEMRRKVIKTQLLKECRKRKEFTKDSIKRREEIQKATYVQKKFGDQD
jgi:small subunit ribosomal protein S21